MHFGGNFIVYYSLLFDNLYRELTFVFTKLLIIIISVFLK